LGLGKRWKAKKAEGEREKRVGRRRRRVIVKFECKVSYYSIISVENFS
jgi:hypothetical protein